MVASNCPPVTRELHLPLSEKELLGPYSKPQARIASLHYPLRVSTGFPSISGLVAIWLHLYCTRWQRQRRGKPTVMKAAEVAEAEAADTALN